MRPPVAASFFVLIMALSSAPAFADPTGDLAQMQYNFAAIKSVHFDITTRDNKNISIDMIKPDKYRGTLVYGVHVVIIGSNTWVLKNGGWRKLPGASGASGDYLQNARTPLNGRPARDYTVVDLGPSSVGAVPARHYRVTRTGERRVDDVWVGANHLPLRVRDSEPRGTTTILYSQYNSVPGITAPV